MAITMATYQDRDGDHTPDPQNQDRSQGQDPEPDLLNRLQITSTVDPQVVIRNRRLIYLQTHDDYFTRSDHAFSLPTLYDQLVGRFMTGRDRREHASDPSSTTKFSEILARDLERGEDRLAQLRQKQQESESMEENGDEDELEEVEDEDGNVVTKPRRTAAQDDTEPGEDGTIDAEKLDADILLHADSDGEFTNVQNREEAWEIWRDILSRRFLRGDDEDFDYDDVDLPGGAGDPKHLIEVEIERDGWEEYFDGEEADVYVERDGKKYLGGKEMEGETGIQDF
ncbi:hypothetical protein TWF694_006582 [Orbilia ellipsospora]|uniref:CCD97-like C-terminal domain-containing protein n=1 Tax=Orbilia ellipsospora TaxID=2528407 RepID=A0AAV9XN50_9PEZI